MDGIAFVNTINSSLREWSMFQCKITDRQEYGHPTKMFYTDDFNIVVADNSKARTLSKTISLTIENLSSTKQLYGCKALKWIC